MTLTKSISQSLQWEQIPFESLRIKLLIYIHTHTRKNQTTVTNYLEMYHFLLTKSMLISSFWKYPESLFFQSTTLDESWNNHFRVKVFLMLTYSIYAFIFNTIYSLNPKNVHLNPGKTGIFWIFTYIYFNFSPAIWTNWTVQKCVKISCLGNVFVLGP